MLWYCVGKEKGYCRVDKEEKQTQWGDNKMRNGMIIMGFGINYSICGEQ